MIDPRTGDILERIDTTHAGHHCLACGWQGEALVEVARTVEGDLWVTTCPNCDAPDWELDEDAAANRG